MTLAPQQSELTRAQALYETNEPASITRANRIMCNAMTAARQECRTETEWRERIDNEFRAHPVAKYTRLDPFIRRCWEKPRGYAGDAVLLDFIYQHPSMQPVIEAAPSAAKYSLQYSTNGAAPRAVRNRAWLLANEIDATARRVPDASILSLACGHLREARMSEAVQGGKLGRFLALDQDVQSIAVVHRENAQFGVEAAEGSVKSVIASRGSLGKFDFVYAAGLYDYLNDKVAARLLQALFDLTKPGGKVWIANFMPEIPDRAFMEAYMDWWLIYRDEPQMMDLAQALPVSELARVRTFVEHDENIVFLEAVRRG